jgi:hypothetical protein
MSLWVKWDVNSHKDDKIAALTDTQFRAFITLIAEVKTLRSGGVFKNRKHAKAVIGSRLGRAVDKLIESGLLTESGDGLVSVSNYSRYQVDPTSTSRGQTWRARKGGESTVPEQSRTEQSRLSPISSLKRDGKSRLLPINEILGEKRNA